MSEGFLGRWSKRKLDVKEGKELQAEPLPEPAQPTAAPAALEVQAASPAPTPVEEPAPLNLDDVKALTKDSDFARFAARDVTPEVKNAAMKKLFADPRYNVMDGMDVYIGDYSKPDPMPYAMLRKLASAKFLGLFDQEEKEEAEAARRARDVADNPAGETVAQSEQAPSAVPEPTPHADPDLRLQQDDAAPGEDPGRGVG